MSALHPNYHKPFEAYQPMAQYTRRKAEVRIGPTEVSRQWDWNGLSSLMAVRLKLRVMLVTSVMFLDFACTAIRLSTAGSGSGAVIRPLVGISYATALYKFSRWVQESGVIEG